jgi:hypothetical protein
MSDWKALLGRVTLFPAAPSPVPSALELFKEIWGGDPDSFQRQTNPLMPTVAQGTQAGMSASCAVQPSRIVLNLEPTRISAVPTVVMIEDTSQLQKSLTQIINVIRKNVVPVSVARVALFVQFLRISDNIADANKTIATVIPKRYGVTLSNEEDFIFQINVPQGSKTVSTIKLNALTKWSVDRIQVISLSVPPAGMPIQTVSTLQHEIKQFIAPTVVFDNNTPIEGVIPFSGSQQAGLLAEALAMVSTAQKEIGLNVTGF